MANYPAHRGQYNVVDRRTISLAVVDVQFNRLIIAGVGYGWLLVALIAVAILMALGDSEASAQEIAYIKGTDRVSESLAEANERDLYGDGEWIYDSISDDADRFSKTSFFDELSNQICGDSCNCSDCDTYNYEFLPRENLYPFYLADTKQSRMAGQWVEAKNDNTLLDGTLGGRFGIFRYVNATQGPFRRGVQLDIETSAHIRLDMTNEHDVRSVDFRGGIPLSFSFGRLHTRIGYYHISSHVGDEFLIKNPGFDRLNYVRDALLLGGAYWLTDSARVYGEATWAFYSDISQPWEFIFGIEDAPRRPTGLRGAPFYAINGRLREEVNYSGAVTAQVGWAWRSSYDSGLLRTGLHYFNGLSNQWSFYREHEQLVGIGLWYDF